MGEDFKKLGCYAKKVVIDKVNDDRIPRRFAGLYINGLSNSNDVI